jgi:hypothetical protein
LELCADFSREFDATVLHEYLRVLEVTPECGRVDELLARHRASIEKRMAMDVDDG